jgi:hypothetical protein
MPPEYRWHGGAVVSAGIDLGSPRFASTWIFVSESDFARGRLHGNRLPAARNAALISASARVTNYTSVKNRVYDRSIDPVRISTRAKVRIEPVRLGTAASNTERARLRAQGIVAISKPRIIASTKSHLDISVPGPALSISPAPAVEDSISVEAPETSRVISTPVEAGVSTHGGLSAPLGGGLGLGGSAGGGLRLGR